MGERGHGVERGHWEGAKMEADEIISAVIFDRRRAGKGGGVQWE